VGENSVFSTEINECYVQGRMKEYFGRYTNVLDAKGRINLPAKFREPDSRDQLFVLARGSEKCIVMFPVGEWRRKNEELDTLVPDGEKRRILRRQLNYYASQQKLDKQGRINIPAELIKYAELDKDVEVIGAGKKIEIWNPKFVQGDLKQSEPEFQKLKNLLDF